MLHTVKAPTVHKIVTFSEYGGPEVLKLVDAPVPVPGQGEVRIKVAALGLNRADILYRSHLYTEEAVFPSRIGYEASGIVDAVGTGVDTLKVGDKVSTIPGFSLNRYGVAGEYAIVQQKHAIKYPDKLTSEQAAAVWMQYLTAYGMLIEFGKLQKDDFVVITAASSSAGIAAIQTANDAGAKTIAVTRKAGKKKALIQAGAHHVVVTEEESLSESVSHITDGQGARIVLDAVGGPMIEVLADVVANEGLIIEYGWLQDGVPVYPFLKAIAKGFRIQGFHLSYHLADKPERFTAGIQYVYERLESGAFKPVIVQQSFELEQIADAYRFMESNEQIGKIVVRVGHQR